MNCWHLALIIKPIIDSSPAITHLTGVIARLFLARDRVHPTASECKGTKYFPLLQVIQALTHRPTPPLIRLIRILMCWEGEGEITFVEERDSGKVEGNSVEKEVGVSSSVVDADEALEVLVESLRLGVTLSAVEVPQNGGGV